MPSLSREAAPDAKLSQFNFDSPYRLVNASLANDSGTLSWSQVLQLEPRTHHTFCLKGVDDASLQYLPTSAEQLTLQSPGERVVKVDMFSDDVRPRPDLPPHTCVSSLVWSPRIKLVGTDTCHNPLTVVVRAAIGHQVQRETLQPQGGIKVSQRSCRGDRLDYDFLQSDDEWCKDDKTSALRVEGESQAAQVCLQSTREADTVSVPSLSCNDEAEGFVGQDFDGRSVIFSARRFILLRVDPDQETACD